MTTAAAQPHRRGVHQVRLLDGAVVSLRRLKKSDMDVVMALHRQLSDREQYFRFFIIHRGYMEEFATKVVERSAENYAVGPRAAHTQVLQPIDIAAQFGQNPGVDEVDANVRHVMQKELDELAAQRHFPILG